MSKDSIKPLLITSVNSNTLGLGAYAVINADGLDGPCFLIKVTNASSEPIFVSYDGVNDHDVLLDDAEFNVDFQNNSRPGNKVALLPKGTRIYVRGNAGQGFIYLSGWYQESI